MATTTMTSGMAKDGGLKGPTPDSVARFDWVLCPAVDQVLMWTDAQLHKL